MLIRTQFCLRWRFRALGLPFNALGTFKVAALGSHWKGLPQLLRPEFKVESDDSRLALNLFAFPEISRRTPCRFRSAGEPFAETELCLFILRVGVVTFCTPTEPWRELLEDTRLITILFAVPICAIDILFLRMLPSELVLPLESVRVMILSLLKRMMLPRKDPDFCIFDGEVEVFGRGPLMRGFSHWRFGTVLSEACSSSATTSSNVGECRASSSLFLVRIGLVTRTELLAESMLEEDMREMHTPCRVSSWLLSRLVTSRCGDLTGSGGTGMEGGWLIGAPKLRDLARVSGLRILKESRSTLPNTAPSGMESSTPADADRVALLGGFSLTAAAPGVYGDRPV